MCMLGIWLESVLLFRLPLHICCRCWSVQYLSCFESIQKSFLPERVIPYWNKLPLHVKNSVTVLSFKIKLEGFKKDMISKSITNDCFIWNVSNEELKEPVMSVIKKNITITDYLWFHPYVAKKRFINLHSTGKFD